MASASVDYLATFQFSAIQNNIFTFLYHRNVHYILQITAILSITHDYLHNYSIFFLYF